MGKNKFDNTIETARLTLRRLSLDDTFDMFEYTSNSLVTTHLSWNPHIDIIQTEKFIKQVIEKYDKSPTEFAYGIELKNEGKLIGVLRIFNVSFANKRGELTSILNPNYQKKGYMGEAWQGLLAYCFNVIGLNRIQSHVTIENIASQRKNDKAGLKHEGTLRQFWYYKRVFHDALVYSITAEDYNNLHKKDD